MVMTEPADGNVFVMPESLEVDDSTLSETYGKFTLQPLERGFGTTLGNGLRRTLLSSLEGSAIDAVRVAGVHHEFTTVPGMIEDVPEFVLNLKEVRLRYHAPETGEKKTILVHKDGPGALLASDLSVDSSVEIINGDRVIANLDTGASVDLELDISNGRGFVLADETRNEDTPIGTVLVDAIYSPVLKANFEVGNARVGQRTDYDRVTLDITTDGTTLPESALSQAARLLRSHYGLFLEEGEIESISEDAAQQAKKTLSVLDMRVEDLELSMRSLNCLRAAGITTLEELVVKSDTDMLKYRNFGRKSLIELTEKLEGLGLSFGMDEESVVDVRAKGIEPPTSADSDEEQVQ